MRNFSSVVPQHNTFHWYADGVIGSNKMDSIVRLFNEAFENPSETPVTSMTPSERRVIADFMRYARACRNRQSNFSKDHPGSFVYTNVNTGVSLVFITWYGYGDFACTRRRNW